MGLVSELTIDDLRQDKLERVAEELVQDHHYSNERSKGTKLVVSKDRLLREIGSKLESYYSPGRKCSSTIDIYQNGDSKEVIPRNRDKLTFRTKGKAQNL